MQTIEKLRELLAKAAGPQVGWEGIDLTRKLLAALPTLLDELERLQKENGALKGALGELVTAVCFADPPKLFNGVECHEARVPVEFVTIARTALQGAADV